MPRRVIIMAVCTLMALGCEPDDGSRAENSESSAAADRTAPTLNLSDFRVDSDEIRYLYYDPASGFSSARRLDDIPLFARPSTAVYHPTDGRPSLDARRFSVADLSEAEPGDVVEPAAMSRKRLIRRSLAAQRAQWHARGVQFVASEKALLHPRSERSQQSRKVLRMLERKLAEGREELERQETEDTGSDP